MNFTKLQSAGNDFVLVAADNRQRDWGEVARAICRRHFGIGADGLLLLLPSEAADFGMKVFNADGSEAEACGNGLRCLIKYAIATGLTQAQEITVATAAGIRKAQLKKKGRETLIQHGMGQPEFAAARIPVEIEFGKQQPGGSKLITGYPLAVTGKELSLSFVAMGNPHAVHFIKQPVAGFPLSQLGPVVEEDKLFPNRVNFEVARVLDRTRIEVRVWERGVGETLACGSGACAVAVAARLLGYVDSVVNIILPGGTLEVEWDGAGEVLLSGPVEIVFSGEWPD